MLGTLAGILVLQALVFLVSGFETKGRALEEVADTDTQQATMPNATSPMARLGT